MQLKYYSLINIHFQLLQVTEIQTGRAMSTDVSKLTKGKAKFHGSENFDNTDIDSLFDIVKAAQDSAV